MMVKAGWRDQGCGRHTGMERKVNYQFIIVLKSSVKSQNLNFVLILNFPCIVEGCGLVEEAGVLDKGGSNYIGGKRNGNQ